jgi:WD40 repeat protein
MNARQQGVGRSALVLTLVTSAFAAIGRAAAPAVPGESPAVVKADDEAAWVALLAPDGKTLATRGTSAVMRLWDVPSLKLRAEIPTDDHNLRAAAYSRDGTLLATGHQKLPGIEKIVWSLAFSPDGKLLAIAGEDKTSTLRDPATGAIFKTLTGHTDLVCGLAFSPDGATLVSASYDKTARLWDVAGGSEKAVLRGHKNWVLAVAYAADGKSLATASFDKQVKL